MEVIRSIEATQVVRVFFLFSTLAGVILDKVPFFQKHFYNYGSRSISPRADKKDDDQRKQPENSSLDILSGLLAHPVPHYWFLHYYVVSLICGLFWGLQILTQGSILRVIVPEPQKKRDGATMHMDTVVFVWALMMFQSGRRLYESYEFMKPSTSTMPLFVYISGSLFYFFVNIAIWVEGYEAILTRNNIATSLRLLNVPSLKTLFWFPVFMCASGIQNDCHRYLASLQKYTLPVHPIFQRLIAPHYSMECLIYLSMAVIAAPSGHWINWTMLTVVLFVTVNLGLVADTTKTWYMQKFGWRKVEGRWRMIPWVW